MSHPERERSLQIELATALLELDEAKANTHGWLSVVEQLRENLNATLLERDEARHGLDEWCKAAMQERAEVKRLRALLGEARDWIADEGSIVPERLVGRMTAALASGGDRG